MDPKKKFFLFRQSKNFCSAPWTNIYLHPDGSIRTCCVGKIEVGNIRHQSIESILDSAELLQIKKDLLNDKENPNCVSCHQNDNDSSSWLRNHYNQLSLSSSINYDDLSQFQLVGADMRWSNTCNFMCIYCSPFLSSSLEKENKIIVSNGNKGNKELLDWIIQQQDTINEVYLAGGEPLLMKENIDFLTRLDSSVKLRVNTNLSNLHSKNPVYNILAKFQHIEWTISIDNLGERFEYTRFGSHWETFLENLSNLISATNAHKIIFNMVYFIGNAITIKQDVKYLKKLVPTADFSFNPVLEKPSLEIRNLPYHLKQRAKQELFDLLALIGKDNRDLINCSSSIDLPPTDQNYRDFFDQIDRKRGTNWKKVFPELAQ